MSPRNAFKFEHGARRGKSKPVKITPDAPDNTSIWILNFQRVRRTLRIGKPIKSMAALLRHLEKEPSVWVGFAKRPLPSTVVLNWQMRTVVQYLRAGVFAKVIRP